MGGFEYVWEKGEMQEFASHFYSKTFGNSSKLSDPSRPNESPVDTGIILPRRQFTEDARSSSLRGGFVNTILFVPLHYQPCLSTLLILHGPLWMGTHENCLIGWLTPSSCSGSKWYHFISTPNGESRHKKYHWPGTSSRM